MRSIPSGRGFSVASQMLTVVKDGLILNIDAGDTNSYPGTGVTWSDRSIQANSLTLTNGPVYDTTTSPNIVFDGVDDYAVDNGNTTLKAISNGGSYTVDAWIKFNSLLVSGQYICGNQNLGVGSYGFGLVAVTNGSIIRFSYVSASSTNTVSFTLPSGIPTSTWMHLVGTFQYDNGTFASVYSVYKNSVQEVNSIAGQPTGTLANSANSFFVGRRPNGTIPASINLASLKIYNKALSADEVKQNFNAGRGRFGL